MLRVGDRDLVLHDYVDAEREGIVERLFEWLRIPSISAHPDHAADVRRSAEFTADHVSLPPHAPALVGKTASDAFNRANPKFSNFDVIMTSLVGRGDLAVTTGGYRTTVAPGKSAAGTPTPEQLSGGVFLALWRAELERR